MAAAAAIIACGVIRIGQLALAVRRSFASASTDVDLVIIPGGDRTRELRAAHLCSRMPTVRAIVISSGACSADEFAPQGEPSVLCDRRATCTVSNFASLVDDLVTQDVRHVLVVTSSEHVKRAGAVAAIILRTRGICVSTRALPTGEASAEGTCRLLRDVARACSVALLHVDPAQLLRLGALVHPRRAHDSRVWLSEQMCWQHASNSGHEDAKSGAEMVAGRGSTTCATRREGYALRLPPPISIVAQAKFIRPGRAVGDPGDSAERATPAT